MGDEWPWGPPQYATWRACRRKLEDMGMDLANARIGAAVATAESSRDLMVLNNTPATGDYSVGAWQINYYGSLYSGRVAEFGTPRQLALGGLEEQAHAAYTLWTVSGWTPWSTYNHGTYKQYLHGGSGGGQNEPTVQQGSTGPAVVTLQDDLNYLGYKLKVDGDFGQQTLFAVQDMQRKNGLTVDGIVGPKTWATLETLTGSSVPAPPPGSNPGSGPSAPHEAPAGVAPEVQSAWAGLQDQVQQGASKQVQAIDGYLAQMKESRT